MGDLKQRIFKIAGELQLVNFATVTEDGKPWVRYVMAKADKDLIFRFCSRIDTKKIGHVKKNPNVHISLGVTDIETAGNWLQVEGKAQVSTDKNERHAFWFEELKNYFTGPDDPSFCIVIVKPSRIELGTMGSRHPELWEG